MKGRRRLNQDFETLETWICAIQRVNGKDKYLSAFEWGMVVGARFECVKNCNLAGFFTLNSFPCESTIVHHPKDIHPTWHNCGKHWSEHGLAFLWNAFDALKSPCPKELRLFWGQKAVQLNIRKVFLNELYTQCTLLLCTHPNKKYYSFL